MKLLLILIALLGVTQLLPAQDDPKVGLVLSGGSAHGIAHVGVIKALEEAGVNVDFVTGTSMGSIIGGLYAMGYTASEIEEICHNQNWSELLATSVPLNEIAPSEKKYHGRFPLTLEYKDGGFSFPQGFLNTQKLDLQLTKMFSPAHDILEFDDLPYPFRCVAVDIEHGEIEVMDSGDLSSAIRASMAIPTVFTPVERDGKLLVDGGLIRNFPVQEALDMGADIIIGVYVGSNLEEKEKLNNLVEILSQSAFMMGILDSEEQKKLVDILIEPDVKELPSFGFDNTGILIREGYLAARKQMDRFKKLASNQSIDQPSLRSLAFEDKVRVSGTRFVKIRKPFDALADFKYGNRRRSTKSLAEIEAGIDRMFGTKHFKNINYTFERTDSGSEILNIDAQTRKITTISGTFNYMPTSNTSLILTSEFRNVINQPSVLFATARLSEDPGVLLNYNYRMGRKKNYLFTIDTRLENFDQYLYEREVLRRNFKQLNIGANLGFGFEPNNELLISAKLGFDRARFKPDGVIEDELQSYLRLDGIGALEISYNNLDNPQFANVGVHARVMAGYRTPLDESLNAGMQSIIRIPQDQAYFLAAMKGEGYYSFGGVVTAQAEVAAGIKTEESLLDNFMLGGIENRGFYGHRLIGLNTNQVHFKNFANVGAGLRLDLFQPLFVNFRTNYVAGITTFYTGQMTEGENIAFWAYGAELGLQSPLGPLRFAYGYNTLTRHWNSNFTFGYTFF